MIEVYKIITGKYDASTALQIIRAHSVVTMVNELRLKTRCTCDLCKYYFINCIVNIWNSLSIMFYLQNLLTVLNIV